MKSSAAPLNFFNPLGNMTLPEFVVIGESLQMYPFMFRELKHIINLRVSATKLDVVLPEYFDGLRSLRLLDLSDNRIVDINPYSSGWNLDITELRLFQNDLLEISEQAFEGLKCLSKIRSIRQLTSLLYRYDNHIAAAKSQISRRVKDASEKPKLYAQLSVVHMLIEHYLSYESAFYNARHIQTRIVIKNDNC